VEPKIDVFFFFFFFFLSKQNLLKSTKGATEVHMKYTRETSN
jgi:hypothetical protein